MGQILHGSARTTEAVRRAIQHSQESLRTLARRHGVNPKTIAKWKKRSSVADRRTGPAPMSTVLSLQQEAVVVAFRRHTLLPLDDCLYALQATIPELTRSSLHRCLQYLPAAGCRRRSAKTKEVQKISDRLRAHRYRRGAHRAGQLYLLVAIDRT
jgi:transposase-like protein